MQKRSSPVRARLPDAFVLVPSWIGVLGEAAGKSEYVRMGKGFKYTGWAGEGISVIINSVNLYNNRTWGNTARLNTSLAIASLNAFEECGGTVISFILSSIDASGGFNGYYNWCDDLEAFFKNNGITPGNLAIPKNIGNPSQSEPLIVIKFF